MKLSDHGLPLSMAFSLLVHLLVFFFLGLLLHSHTTATQKDRRATTLEVRITQPLPQTRTLPQKRQTRPGKKLLTSTAPAPYKIAQPGVDNPVPLPSARVADQPPPHTAQAAGIGFPGAVATPWPGQIRSMSSFFNTRPPQFDAERIYYQQTMEAQARQQAEQRAQLMVEKLQQLLAKLLNVDPVVPGKCLLAETDGVVDDRLKCDSPALHELLYKDEKNVAGMLLALRGMGKMLNGFAAEPRADGLGIMLIYQNE